MDNVHRDKALPPQRSNEACLSGSASVRASRRLSLRHEATGATIGKPALIPLTVTTKITPGRGPGRTRAVPPLVLRPARRR